MADHRAEQIMDAFFTNIDGLATTKNSVKRDRPYNVESGVNCALSLYQGSDVPYEEGIQNWTYQDMMLTVVIEIFVKAASTTPISQTLNQIRKEITVALQAVASPPLGLGFCHEIEEGESFEPQLEVAEQPTAVQRFEWLVKYRRSRADPSA